MNLYEDELIKIKWPKDTFFALSVEKFDLHLSTFPTQQFAKIETSVI
jgi:hypothetical protein